MCGHVGVAGDLFARDIEAFKQLLVVDSVRGVHGTGVAGVARNGETTVAKLPSHPFDLIENKQFDRAANTGMAVLIGHNRYMTTGRKTSVNTHPFDFHTVVGAHNGTLSDYSRRKLSNAEFFETDSEAIFNDMDDNFRMRAKDHDSAMVSKTIDKLSGAWALVFVIKGSRELCMIRNDQRPLFYVYSKDRKRLWWASELQPLLWILDRNQIEHEKPFVVNENMLYSWKIPYLAKEFEQPKLVKTEGFRFQLPPKKEEEPKKEEVVKQDNLPLLPKKPDVDATAYPHSVVKDDPRSTEEQLGSVHHLQARPIMSVDEIKKKAQGKEGPPYYDTNGKVLHRPEFEKAIKESGGCTYCDHYPSWGETTIFLRNDDKGRAQALCCECIEDDEVMQIMGAMRA